LAAYYFDTSALVKRYVQEPGTIWVTGVASPMGNHDIYVVRITGPEMIAAFFRKARRGEAAINDVRRAAEDSRSDFRDQYQVVEITEGIADRAMLLAQQHGLRGYDAVQLAAAAELHGIRNRMGLLPLTLISADGALNTAAQAEGLAVDDPNDHS
jgi:predicted nucleic acid-binding protein